MKLCFLVVSFFLVAQITCSRILVLYPFGTPSHKFSIYPVLEALVSKGHSVTLVSSFPPKEAPSNIREIVLPKYVDENLFEAFFKLRKMPAVLVGLNSLDGTAFTLEKIFNSLMAQEEFQQILHDKSVDLVLVDAIYNDFCMPIIEHLQVPFVLVSPGHPMSWHIEMLGGQVSPATLPFTLSHYGRDMSFLERANNFVIYYGISLGWRFILVPRMEKFTREHFPGSSSIIEIEKKASLLLIPTHPTSNWPRSLPPTVIEVGPLHCRQPKPLPEDLQRIVDDSSEHGFIIFSMGSVMGKSTILEKYFEVFLKVFAKIPQRVIWKWDKHVETPPNVRLTSWVPQQDLLGHPNARLFISHCGLLGIQKAIYHGVPLLALPIALDQHANAAKVVHEGMALKLDWDELTETEVFQTITSLINNSSFKSKAEKLSRIMRDTLVPGTEKAVFWIEHVLKHNGTSHLHFSNNLAWYQYYLLDVILLITVLVSCFFTATILLCLKTTKYFTSRKPTTKVKKNQ